MSSIVRLNVGGTKYEVARSTIDQYPETMLARLISETWREARQSNDANHNETNDTLFIDRDGPRFQFVLDYMRDQEVHLPINVAKGALLKDLEYFGFNDVPEEAIKINGANFAAAQHMITCAKVTSEKWTMMHRAADFTEMAHQIFVSFSTKQPDHNGRYTVQVSVEYHKKYFHYGRDCQHIAPHSQGYDFSGYQKEFDTFLEEYGLRYIKHNRNDVIVAPLERL